MKYKYYLIIAAFLFLLSSNKSHAALIWDQSATSTSHFDFSKIFSGLSLPQTDFTKSTQQINQDVSNLPFQKYKFISDLGQNNLVKDVYSFFVGIVKLIAGIVIWILEFILVIIRRGLSFIS